MVGSAVGSGVDVTVSVDGMVGSGVGANVAVRVGASVCRGSDVATEVTDLSSQAESSAIETKLSANSLAIQYLAMQHPFVASITTGGQILNRPQIRRD